jgi:hypothetical protein
MLFVQKGLIGALSRFSHNWNDGRLECWEDGFEGRKQFINDLFRFYYPTFHPSSALAGIFNN